MPLGKGYLQWETFGLNQIKIALWVGSFRESPDGSNNDISLGMGFDGASTLFCLGQHSLVDSDDFASFLTAFMGGRIFGGLYSAIFSDVTHTVSYINFLLLYTNYITWAFFISLNILQKH